MIKWEKISEDEWIVSSDEKSVKVNGLRSLIAYSMAFGLNIDDIEQAQVELIRRDHDYCEFGIWGSFIYSEKINQEVSH